MKYPFFIFKQNTGFSVMELLMAMGIMGIGTMLLMRSQSTMTQSLSMNRSIASRDSLFINLEKHSQEAKFVAQSMPPPTDTKSELGICWNGTASPTGCVANKCVNDSGGEVTCAAGLKRVPKVYEFNLKGYNNIVVAGLNIYYSTEGAICTDVTSPICTMRAVALLHVICPGNADSCAKAESLEVGVTLTSAKPLPMGTFAAGGKSSGLFMPYTVAELRRILDSGGSTPGTVELVFSNLQVVSYPAGVRGRAHCTPCAADSAYDYVSWEKTVMCPAGYKAVGGGAKCSGLPVNSKGYGCGYVIQSFPTSTGSGWSTSCCAMTPQSGNQTSTDTAFATCVKM